LGYILFLAKDNERTDRATIPIIAEWIRPLTSTSVDSRTYPTRPFLAVSAVIFRDGRVLIVRRGRPPSPGVYTLPGGGVELGETLEAAVIREVREETGLDIEPVELAGYRQVIMRDANGKIERHFVILPFAARWIGGEISLNEELIEANWLLPSEISGLKTTEGLAEIVAVAGERLTGRR
jgi:8-oxo-dGTP diphosphatase